MNRADQKQIAIDWEKMQHLSELTIVVPTYTRQMDALQQMHFWSSSPVELYVLDGTSEPISNKYLKNLGKNIHYINMQRSVEERFCFVLDKIKTPYVAVSSDDEFFIPSALESCIDYLKERKEFIACIGRVMAFHLSKKGMVAKQMYGAMKNYKIENETAAERMLAHMNPYMYTSVHAVQCTDVWKKSIKIIGINENPLSCPYAPELQVELATCYQGKSAVIEKLMWLRNKENKVISDRAYDRNLQLYEWFKKKKYEGEVELFYEITSEELARIGGEKKEKVLADLKVAISACISEFHEKKYLKEKMLGAKRKIIDGGLKEEFYKVMQDARYSLWKPIMTEAKIMVADGVDVDMKQLDEIVKHIVKDRVKGD